MSRSIVQLRKFASMQRCAHILRPSITYASARSIINTASVSSDIQNEDQSIQERIDDEENNSTRPRKKWEPEPLSPEHIQRNEELVQRLKGELILAPLTRGGNLPFRRLCADFGARVTVGEMIFARTLIKSKDKSTKEKALLRRAPNESVYGIQIATNVIGEGVRAGLMAVEQGNADFIDLNCGCPIYEATRRGLGSALLRKPEKLARLVAGIASQLPVPLTVKVRTGLTDSGTNVQEVVRLLKDAGAAAVTLHGRSAMARYKRPADWSLIETVAETSLSNGLPIIGNGDVLTRYEAVRRMNDSSNCLAVMVGRGALTRPWIFEEVRTGKDYLPTTLERVGIYRKLVSYMKEHFGDDDLGKRKAFYFLPWHIGFLNRYRPLPESVFSTMSLQQPLISTRWESAAVQELGETVDTLPSVERLLRLCDNESAYEEIAHVVWESLNDDDAMVMLEKIADEKLLAWEGEAKESLAEGVSDGDSEDGRRR